LRIRIVALFLILSGIARAQVPVVDRIEPPNWWVGMRQDTLQLMIEGRDLQDITVLSSSACVLIVHVVSSPKYAFVEVVLGENLNPGKIDLNLNNGRASTAISYPMFRREKPTERYQGFSPADVIYLITPDRFANGDTTNDSVVGMKEGLERDEPYGRHGGDIQGVIDRLDYLRDLGVTALWLNPVVENNGKFSYHGYAVTDMYRIDPRFGTNTLYSELVAEAHRRGLKIIMDHVSNHIGINHRWVRSLPTPDWLHGSPENHLPAYHGKLELTDIHADSSALTRVHNGWFSDAMPDLNQQNSFVEKYIIQNTIWWIETTGLDGIREDTYPYIDPAFASRWAKAIRTEYPRFSIVGEVWIQDPAYLPPYQEGGATRGMPDTHLNSLTDFGLFDAFGKVFWDSASISEIYRCLTKDFLYPHPENLVTFLDNHDTQRIMRVNHGDVRRTQFALGLLLTLRGIPQIYYGTEIGMTQGPDHGSSRADFPGGFPGDTRNAFAAEGRTKVENEMSEYVRELLRIRKLHPALQTGKLVHFPPKDDVYCYFRISETEKILVVANNNGGDADVNIGPFRDKLGEGSIRDVKTGKSVRLDGDIIRSVPRYSVNLYQAVLTHGE